MKAGPPLASFADWIARLKVYSNYISTLASYKREQACAERARAHKRGAAELARAYSCVAKELETQSRLMHKVTSQLDREAALIAQRERRAQILLTGRRVNGSLASAWTAYWWFESRALLESANAVYAVQIDARTRSGECYFDNRDESRPCESVPDEITTATGLAVWMHRMNYLPRAGSQAQRKVAELFRAMNDIAGRTVAELHAALADMQRGTYSTWRPRVVMGMPPSAVAARIELAGARLVAAKRGGSARRVPKPHHRPGRTKHVGSTQRPT